MPTTPVQTATANDETRKQINPGGLELCAMPSPLNDIPPKFMTAKAVRHRYGDVSNMWLYRMMMSGGFPQPTRLNKSADPRSAMRHWLVADLDRWDDERDAGHPDPAGATEVSS
jgi:predicted DNA-binding transcriptional regulator AlpA